MAYQAVFKRYELKYLLTLEQKETMLETISPYMELDQYGRTTIRNLYFDTDNYRLIRRSIEKPPYKEKLRLRSYTKAEPNSTVYVELKKKYDSVVYKRRISMPESQALEWLTLGQCPPEDTQISREIRYVMDYYQTLHPTVFLSYEREAYFAKDGSDLRITFDDRILSRQDDLSLESEIYGIPILPDGKVLMEIKSSRGLPLWLAKSLSAQHIYKTSYSKYGTAYEKLIYPTLREETYHA